MYGCRTPPDVVSGSDDCRGSRSELDCISTPRHPSDRGTRRIMDRSPDDMVSYSLTSSPGAIASLSPLTSSTPECAVSGKCPRTASRHVGFRLDDSEPSPPCVDTISSGDPIRRPTELDVGYSPTGRKERRRQTKSMIMIGEDDVDELFQPVNINGDSFALLQTSLRSFTEHLLPGTLNVESVESAELARVKKSPLRTCGNFSKTVENFATIFYVPIVRSYLRKATNFIQLPAILTKLCHIKRDHPLHIMCAKCPPSAETHASIF